MPSSNSPAIYWFRNDLRLEDNPALLQACKQSSTLLPVFCHALDPDQLTRWKVPRTSQHREHFLGTALADCDRQLAEHASRLLEVQGDPVDVLPVLALKIGATTIYCEDIAAPEEQDQVAALRAAGLIVHTVWQSSMLNPTDLPFSPNRMPDVFTSFRSAIEREGVLPDLPVARPEHVPPLPANFAELALGHGRVTQLAKSTKDTRSSFPYFLPEFGGGAAAAVNHLRHYFSKNLAQSYKLTRNGLAGVDYSTKFSPWLASGAISARQIYQELKRFEEERGANDSTYWIWFELLWRDYFRILHLKYGRQLYRAAGLTNLANPPHDKIQFQKWCQAATGVPFVDAGMAELTATGYMSNRLRQNVASFLVHDLRCDWRAGAAWFEANLIDYDVYSNQGNWLYVAGRGTDPRTGRRFNIQKQANDYDSDGAYRKLWAA